MTQTEEGGISLLAPQTLRQLFQQLEATDVDELEIEYGTSRLYVRREPGRVTGILGAAPALADRPAIGTAITAPLAGVFYSRPSPEQEPFAPTGSIIEPGQVVGLIETMKMFNEVVSDISGEVVSVDAGDGDLVEAGQPLLYVSPLDEGEDR